MKIVIYYKKDCPFCDSVMSQIDKFKKTGKLHKDTKIEKIDQSDLNPSEKVSIGIKLYPTIIVKDDDDITLNKIHGSYPESKLLSMLSSSKLTESVLNRARKKS